MSPRSAVGAGLRALVGVLFGVLLAAGFARQAAAQDEPSVRRVLVVYGGGRDDAANTRFESGLRAALKSDSADIEYFSEYLEADRFDGAEQSPAFRNYLKTKYARQPIDLVVAFSSAALDFLLEHRSDVFPSAPIVFHMVGAAGAAGSHGSNVTGIAVERPYGKTVGLALALHPGTKEVLIVTGASKWDRLREGRARAELEPYAGRATFTYLTGLPMATMMSRVKTAPAHSIVFYVRDSRDEPGQELSAEDMLGLITSVAPVPVYTVASGTMGRGSVGGYIFDPRRGGRLIGELANRILDGEPADSIPISTLEMTPTFDMRQLRKWSISEALLPPESSILFDEGTLFQRYEAYVAGGGLVFAAQGALISGLLLQRRRRRLAEQRSRNAESRYRSIVDTQSELICRYLPDTTLTFVNDAYCRFWNKTPDELLGTKFIHLVPDEARATVLAEVGGLRGTSSHEHAVSLTDGTIGWQHWINHAVLDEQGGIVEVQGIGRDVTDRRRAQEALVQVEERNSAFLKAIPDLMFVQERDGTYVDYHAPDPRLLLVEPSVFLGRRVRDILPPHLGDLFMDAIERVASGESESAVIDYELSLPECRHFEARLVRAEGGRVLSIVRDVTESKKTLEENRHLVGRLIASQEVERQRIGRELHDDLSQKIALLNIDLDRFAAQTPLPDHRSRLREISLRAGEIANDVHQLSHELHPSKLQTLGLVSAMQSLCRDVSRQGTVIVEFSHDEMRAPVSPDVALCLYRITQEALHNVARHSHAAHASVYLTVERGNIRLYIADSGIGFDGQNIAQMGLGLISMRERVSLVKGRLILHTMPGHGTRIGVIVPVEEPVETPAPLATSASA